MDKTLKKKQILESEEFEKPEQKEEKADFEGWFGSKVTAGELSRWQYEEVAVFFKKNGLSSKETMSTYDKCFERF